VAVGIRPNGLAFDPVRGFLLTANVGDPATPASFTVSIVDMEKKTMIASVPVSGRTRWTVYDADSAVFLVNIADPPQIAVIDPRALAQVARVLSIPAAGPHGLDLDRGTHRLFCGCDAKQLVSLDLRSGAILSQVEIAGVPDVAFFNEALGHLYVAIGDPGVIEVFETESMRRLEVIRTEKGAHTIAFDAARNAVFAFLPETHCAAIYHDRM
jgi:DNA-binding beta-propeller fold protein YncE